MASKEITILSGFLPPGGGEVDGKAAQSGKGACWNVEKLTEYINQLDYALGRLLYRVRMLHNRYTVDEISDTQFIVLRSLRRAPCNTSFLAQMLGVTLSAVTAMVNRLHRMGLVERERLERDRRQVWITITPRGLEILKSVEERRNLLLAVYVARVPEEERQELLRLLNRAVALFEREDILNEELPPDEPPRHS